MNSPYKIAVVGLWHLGEIYSAGLAELGHQVVGISDDKKTVDGLLKSVPPLPEPGLKGLLSKNISLGRLRYATDFSTIKSCNVLWVTFDTPVDEDDDVDMSPIYSVLSKSISHLQDGVLIVMTSQVPVGTAETVKEVIKRERPSLRFDYVYSPENLRLGEAVRSFMEPARIIVGVEEDNAWNKMEEIFSLLKTTIVRMSPVSAEMAKHALNAFLATSISFMNDIADLCEKTGADVLDVAKALHSDPRIGPRAFLDAGLGFSGGTLGRDLKALGAASKRLGTVLPIIEAVFRKNLERKNLVVDRLKEISGDLKNRKIAILGLTYKPGTKTLRRSRALEIARDLSGLGAVLNLYDPVVEGGDLPETKNTVFFSDPYKAISGAQIIVIITPWPEFRGFDFRRLGAIAPGAILLDTPNLLHNKEDIIRNCGLKYFGVGRKPYVA